MQDQRPLTLYERLGGENAIQAAVDLFYEKVLDDPLLGGFFRELDMSRQVKKMVAFMTRAFDGPADYQGRDLREAHRTLVARGLSDAHFDAVATHLRTTLEELDVAPALIAEVLALVGGTRDAVLSRGP